MRFPLVLRQSTTVIQHGLLLPASQVARLADVPLELVFHFINLGLLDPVETTTEPCFAVSAVLRIRRMVRIHHDLGVNWTGLGVVMDLLNKIEDLEEEIARLKAERENQRS
jgi:MerR-like DNA binding protein